MKRVHFTKGRAALREGEKPKRATSQTGANSSDACVHLDTIVSLQNWAKWCTEGDGQETRLSPRAAYVCVRVTQTGSAA